LEVWIQSKTSPYGVCGGQSATGTDFCPRFFPVSNISPAVYIYSLILHLLIYDCHSVILVIVSTIK